MGFWRKEVRCNGGKIDLCGTYYPCFYELLLQAKERESRDCIKGCFWNSFTFGGLLFGRCVAAVEKEVV